MALTNNCVLAKAGDKALVEATANVQPGDRIPFSGILVVAENLSDRITGDVESVRITSSAAKPVEASAPAASSEDNFAAGLVSAIGRRSRKGK